ncbi:MAG: hypothetical protein ACI92S_003208 [Planctomycetaceae bacterium]|jgi:hypothetical protein
MTDITYKDECYRVTGACFEVYKGNGCGFVESVNQDLDYAEGVIPNSLGLATRRRHRR